MPATLFGFSRFLAALARIGWPASPKWVALFHRIIRPPCTEIRTYQEMLKGRGIIPSMSRKGDCWDNAPMESFFHTLKVELVHHRDYGTREEARKDIIEYIEMFYNWQRLHSSLGYTTPAEHERMPLARTA